MSDTNYQKEIALGFDKCGITCHSQFDQRIVSFIRQVRAPELIHRHQQFYAQLSCYGDIAPTQPRGFAFLFCDSGQGKPILDEFNNLMGDPMKLPLIALAAMYVIAGTAYADRQAMDKAASKTAVPGIGDSIFIEREDVKAKKQIGETEKNLPNGWGTGKGDTRTQLEVNEKSLMDKKLPPSR